MRPPERGKGRPGREAALSEVEIHGRGIDLSRVRHGIRARQPIDSAPAALRRLRPADRARVLDRLAELRALEVLARQRGTLAAEAVSR